MAYNPSDHKAINQPFGMGAIPLNSKSLFYDTNLLKYRPFQNVAEVNTYFANLTFRDPTFDVIVNTGGTLLNGIITGGVNDVYWFRDGVNLVKKETDLSNYYDEQQIDAFLLAINLSISDLSEGISTHINNTNNPHQVTKTQVGLGNVDNTSDLNKPISTATQQAIDDEEAARIAADALKADKTYVDYQDNELLNIINTKANSADIRSNVRIQYADLDSGTHTTYINTDFANLEVYLQTLAAGGVGTSGYFTFDSNGVLDLSSLTPGVDFDATIFGVVGVLSDYLSQSDITTAFSKNLFNKDGDLIVGQMDAIDGDIIDIANWFTSDYIAVYEGDYFGQSATSVLNNTMRRVISFDANKVIIPDAAGNAGGITLWAVDAGVSFVRISVHADALSTFQFERNTQKTAYVPYQQYISKINNLPIIAKDLSDGALLDVVGDSAKSVVNKEFLTEQGYGVANEITLLDDNLFNQATIVPDRYINTSTGAISTAAGWAKSAAIPLLDGQTHITISTDIDFPSGRSYRFTGAGGVVLEFANITTNPQTLPFPVGALNFEMTVLKSGETILYDTLMVVYGIEAKPYVPFGGIIVVDNINDKGVAAKYLIDSDNNLFDSDDFVKKGESSIANGIKLITSSGETSEISYTFQGKSIRQVLRSNRPLSADLPNLFDWAQTYVDSVLVHNMGDENAPFRVTSATIGANHGYFKTRITTNAHGKTNVDVGSIYTDGALEWIIVNIFDVNNIDVSCRTTNGNLTANSLTHVSGGTNTTAINSTVKTASLQIYPCCKNRSLDIYIDNTLVSGEGEFFAENTVTYSESYDILDKNSVMEWFITQAGTSTKIIQVDGDPIIRINTTFIFDKTMGCLMVESFTGINTTTQAFQDIMFNMNNPITATTARKVYVPKSLPFVHQAVNYNFSIPTEITATLTARINFTPARCEPTGILCDRRIEITNTLGYAIGFLPVEDADPSVRRSMATNKALQIAESEKTYMSAIDTASITTFDKGDCYSVSGYKKYFFVEAGRTCNYVVSDVNGNKYLYLDWHVNGMDTILLDESLIGRPFELIEKSSNVTLFNKSATKQLTIDVAIDGVTTLYGYLILKFL